MSGLVWEPEYWLTMSLMELSLPMLLSFSSSDFQPWVAFLAWPKSPLLTAVLTVTATRMSMTIIVIIKAINVIPELFDFFNI